MSDTTSGGGTTTTPTDPGVHRGDTAPPVSPTPAPTDTTPPDPGVHRG